MVHELPRLSVFDVEADARLVEFAREVTAAVRSGALRLDPMTGEWQVRRNAGGKLVTTYSSHGDLVDAMRAYREEWPT